MRRILCPHGRLAPCRRCLAYSWSLLVLLYASYVLAVGIALYACVASADTLTTCRQGPQPGQVICWTADGWDRPRPPERSDTGSWELPPRQEQQPQRTWEEQCEILRRAVERGGVRPSWLADCP